MRAVGVLVALGLVSACDGASTDKKAPPTKPLRESRDVLAKAVEAKAKQIGMPTTREEHYFGAQKGTFVGMTDDRLCR
jgi:hypothetical protein